MVLPTLCSPVPYSTMRNMVTLLLMCIPAITSSKEEETIRSLAIRVAI